MKHIRRMAGLFVMVGGAGVWVHPAWFAHGVRGFNLLQSSLTGFCLPERVSAAQPLRLPPPEA